MGKYISHIVKVPKEWLVDFATIEKRVIEKDIDKLSSIELQNDAGCDTTDDDSKVDDD